MSLNPCCSGRWSSTAMVMAAINAAKTVLILVVVDDGLVRMKIQLRELSLNVLILVVVDDGLVLNGNSTLIQIFQLS